VPDPGPQRRINGDQPPCERWRARPTRSGPGSPGPSESLPPANPSHDTCGCQFTKVLLGFSFHAQTCNVEKARSPKRFDASKRCSSCPLGCGGAYGWHPTRSAPGNPRRRAAAVRPAWARRSRSRDALDPDRRRPPSAFDEMHPHCPGVRSAHAAELQRVAPRSATLTSRKRSAASRPIFRSAFICFF
jgi:hypothetical protein